MQLADSRQLTYCTNIHPANGWQEVFESLTIYAPALKARLSPGAPFGLGLRLSAPEAAELLANGALRDFRQFLAAERLYVALVNGYPYGRFSGAPLKAGVFTPGWQDPERVRYTLQLLQVVAELLPDGMDGGISTVPLSYKPAVRGEDCWTGIIANLAQVCAAMARARQHTGKLIHLDIEPEPDGLIENTAETLAFFRDRLLPRGAPLLAEALGTPVSRAGDLLLEHIRVCLDTCHFSVEYEDPAASLAAFARAGIRIGRVQVSSALVVPLAEQPAEWRARLGALAEPVYLHQVIERLRDGSLRRYRDLPQALAAPLHPDACEWRIHFHVPLFAPDFDGWRSTRESIPPVLVAQPAARHLEIETYTWSVLPAHRRLGLLDSIEREYAWVLEQLCARRP